MKKLLLFSDIGYASVMRRARDIIFWLGMSKEIQQMADNCHIC